MILSTIQGGAECSGLEHEDLYQGHTNGHEEASQEGKLHTHMFVPICRHLAISHRKVYEVNLMITYARTVTNVPCACAQISGPAVKGGQSSDGDRERLWGTVGIEGTG